MIGGERGPPAWGRWRQAPTPLPSHLPLQVEAGPDPTPFSLAATAYSPFTCRYSLLPSHLPLQPAWLGSVGLPPPL